MMRFTHKLRALPNKKKEFVLCKGREDVREMVRYFWQNVTCPHCKRMRKKNDCSRS